MNGIAKLLTYCFIGSLVTVPYLAGRNGYGLGTERNADVIKRSANDCPPEMKDPITGKCRRSHRSGLRSRGYGFGK